MIRLTWRFTCEPDFDGYRYYVEHGDVFDISDYCEVYCRLDPSEVNHNDIANVQAAAANTMPGVWLEVSHEIED